MLTHLNVTDWPVSRVRDWLAGVCDNQWLDSDRLTQENIDGKKLLMLTADELSKLGATKIGIQESILEAIENLRFYNFNLAQETLQNPILRLSCQSRSLQKQLAFERSQTPKSVQTEPKNIVLSSEFNTRSLMKKQRVSLDTLSSVSVIVQTVRRITSILNCLPFSKHDEFRSMKSLLLALSIELSSTAQRDQFVEKPNDIIERSSKALADYCDKILLGTKNLLLVQPFFLETVRIRRDVAEDNIGLRIKSSGASGTHLIEKIMPLSLAKKTDKLHEGDEIVLFNKFIIGWSERNVNKLIDEASRMTDILMIVKKSPAE